MQKTGQVMQSRIWRYVGRNAECASQDHILKSHNHPISDTERRRVVEGLENEEQTSGVSLVPSSSHWYPCMCYRSSKFISIIRRIQDLPRENALFLVYEKRRVPKPIFEIVGATIQIAAINLLNRRTV